MRIPYYTCLVSGLLSVALLGGCAATAGNTPKTDTAQEAETPAPADGSGLIISVFFEAKTIDNTEVSSSICSDSRLTVVNVWATYCGPCLNEMPDLGELAGTYDPSEVQFIGIISDVLEDADEQTLAAALDLIEETQAKYPHLLLNESLYQAFLTDVTAVPTTFFLDQNGQIVDTIIGAREKSKWEELIDAFLED